MCVPATLETMKEDHSTGREAPMVIWPRDVARLLRQIYASLRSKRTSAEKS
jgi:hypothetical protein